MFYQNKTGKTVEEDLTHYQKDICNASSFRSRYLEVTKNSQENHQVA